MSRWFWRESGGLGPTDAFLREAEDLPRVRSGKRSSKQVAMCEKSISFQSTIGDEPQYDHFFKTATLREQLALKCVKAKIVVWNMCQTGCGLRACLPIKKPATSDRVLSLTTPSSVLKYASAQSNSGTPGILPPQVPGGTWQGQTLQQIENMSEKWWSAAQCPSWRVGNANDLMMRAEGYASYDPGHKEPATESLPFGSMYECVSCDAVSSSKKIEDVVGKLVQVDALPRRSAVKWSEDCPLPRVLCINLMLPYTTGSNDPGCSYIALFHIKPEVLEALRVNADYKCIKKFIEFCHDPAGEASVLDHPERSLQLRRAKQPKNKVNDVSGIFKAIAHIENAEDLSLNFLLRTMVRSYNGKPTVITKSGYVVKARPGAGPPGAWMEIGIDVRGFNLVARRYLCSYRDSHLPLAAIHFGFMIQAVNDDELPEGLIADMHVFGIDMNNVHMLSG